MNVSVIICTYNGSKTILDCLEHIRLQKTKLNFELIIIDNNSTDDTFSIVQDWIVQNKNINAYFYKVLERGKVHALGCGIKKSLGEIVIICDDDNFLKNDYLENANVLLNSNDEIGLISGVNIAIASREFPTWFHENERFYGCGSAFDNEGDITMLGNLWGAGMVARGKLIRAIYNSNISHFMLGIDDKEGNRIMSEDTELCIWFRILGLKLYYSHKLELKHFMTESRLTINYLEKLKLSCSHVSKKLNDLKLIEVFYHFERKFIFSDLMNLFQDNPKGLGIRIRMGVEFNNLKIKTNIIELKKIKDNSSVCFEK